MRALEGWRVTRRRDPVEIEIFAPDGRRAARIVPAPLRLPRTTALLRMTDQVRQAHDSSWRKAAGWVPDQGRTVVELAGGETMTVRNGWGGPKRSLANVRVTVAGRRYVCAHTSGCSAEIRRDGDLIVVAVVEGLCRARRPNAVRAAYGLGVGLDVLAPLDRTDELMVVLFTDVYGPPGRKGAVRRVLDAVKEDFLTH